MIAETTITKKLYGNINRYKTAAERYDMANTLIKSLGCEKPKNIFDEVFEMYQHTWRERTAQSYATVKNVFIKYLAGTPPQTATAKDITMFLNHLAAQKKHTTTINKYQKFISTLYNYAMKLNLCKSNPVSNIPTIKRTTTSKSPFTDAQASSIIQVSKEKNFQLYIAILLQYYCYIRPAEIRLLRVEDINLEMNCIEIRAEISKNQKTQKVALPAQLKKELLPLMQYANKNYLLSTSGAPGATPLMPRYLNAHHQKILDALYIRGRYSFYSWKHTGVVRAVKAGINIRDIQNQLRHHSLDMVQEYLKGLGVLQSDDLVNNFPSI